MQSEIEETNLLRNSIVRFSAENDKIKAENNKIKAENDKIRVENTELKARIAKLEDKQTQNELIKNLLSACKSIVLYAMDYFACKLFLRKTIPNKMFYSNYKHIIDRLSESLIKRVCERLLHHSKDPVPLESIFGKSKRIESYLRHTLKVYENSLNRKKCKTMAQEKIVESRPKK
ncbi:hypothetical protein C1646_777376 [Rhizophagus diaphanus]|nr:hypothetical protein C1646_777376 [Rhizophagus diaphanus] [Rhizophagus sp. MUCL 43196]